MLETLIYSFIVLSRSMLLTQYSRYIHRARLNMTIVVAIPLALTCIHTSGKAMDGQGEAQDNQREASQEPRVPQDEPRETPDEPREVQEASRRAQDEPI